MGFQSKPEDKLRREDLRQAICAGAAGLQTVLQLKFAVRGEAVAGTEIDSPRVFPPSHGGAVAITDLAVELLVPAHGPEKLRGEFIFCLEIIGERPRIAH